MKTNSNKQLIVVAGAGSGLGRETAILAARKGYYAILLGRSKETLNETEDLIWKANGEAKTYPIDLTDDRATEKIFAKISSEHGQPRALVNCVAKWMGRKPFQDLNAQELIESFSVNCLTAFNAIRETLKIWDTLRQDLTIVNVGATSSLAGRANVLAFGIGKGALRTLSQSLAKELGPQGVHVAHLIVDGLLDNPRTRSLSQNVPEESFMSQQSVAESILTLIEQELSCWTFELDVRPFNEKF